jgi:2-haloacid dehalogenase
LAASWDVLGALRAGCAAAFVARPGKAMFALGPQPDVIAPNLTSAADRITELDA